MTKAEEYTTMANAMSEETKQIFDKGADAIIRTLDESDVCLTPENVVALSKLGMLLKILPSFADRAGEVEI